MEKSNIQIIGFFILAYAISWLLLLPSILISFGIINGIARSLE